MTWLLMFIFPLTAGTEDLSWVILCATLTFDWKMLFGFGSFKTSLQVEMGVETITVKTVLPFSVLKFLRIFTWTPNTFHLLIYFLLLLNFFFFCITITISIIVIILLYLGYFLYPLFVCHLVILHFELNCEFADYFYICSLREVNKRKGKNRQRPPWSS